MIRMANRKHTTTPGETPPPKGTRRGRPLHVWLDPRMREALDALAARTRRLITTEVVMALEKHLAEAGLWPPPAAG